MEMNVSTAAPATVRQAAPGAGGSVALIRYDAARKALAAAHRVDEVKDIHDKAIAIAAYARQAKDSELIEHATEIRKRAERRLGQIMAETPKAKGGKPYQGDKRTGSARDPVKTLADEGIDKHLADRARKAAAKSEEDFEADVQRATNRAVAAVDGKKHKGDVRGAFNTGEVEWYTPVQYINAARAVLGGIDLDPATSEPAQKRVKAERFFTADDDGLAHDWHGRVWLNPPYSQSLIAKFVAKLVKDYKAGRVTAAILLTHNCTDTAWFHQAAGACDAICFTRGRIRFESPHSDSVAPPQGQAFFYFGDNVEAFRAVFSAIGFVVRTAWSDEAALEALL